MQKIITLVLLLFLFPYNYLLKEKKQAEKEIVEKVNEVPDYHPLYTEIGLDTLVDYVAFEQAMIGFNKIEEKNKDIITLIDFTKPSNEERFYVIDINEKKILYASLVSHGRNSGDVYATSFSNEYGSYKSSLGFFVTENTYQGKNGYSLRLNGLEKGINDRAKERAIVVHGSKYIHPSRVEKLGRIGRSLGCPALPHDVTKEIINVIKEGSVIYIYADDTTYLAQSPILTEEDNMI